jgi:heme-NO-binding protein
MHGLVFVTWEKYLAERFGPSLLNDYRQAIGQGVGDAPLASRVYDDERLNAAIAAASRLTVTPVDTLLREYGRYFIVNGLTSRLCSYLLNQVYSARDLLLVMRDAHEQISQVAESVTPPLFQYRPMPDDPDGLYLIYDSPRQLCPLLVGAIEGGASRYGEQAMVTEESCMRRGAPVCVFAVHFIRPAADPQPPGRAAFAASSSPSRASLGSPPPASIPGQDERAAAQRRLADMLYAILPDAGGITLSEAQARLRAQFSDVDEAAHPFLVLEALNHLHHAGWVATTANQPGDTLGSRRYWRLPRVVN